MTICSIGRRARAQGAWQSTLIAYKGAEEVARSVGETNPGLIEALLKSAL
jgi:hypothetical protein